MLVHRLTAYFASKYDEQRKSLILALALILMSLFVIAVRYCAEAYFFEEKIVMKYDENNLKLTGILLLLTLSDFIPISS